MLNHCKSFNSAFDQVTKCVKENGFLYLYLYGRETLSFKEEMKLFKKRIRYNTLQSSEEKYRFLLNKAKGISNRDHNIHDLYAPIINRRLEFDFIRDLLLEKGFEDIVRTIDHTELFIRAIKGGAEECYRDWILPKKEPPYWFQYHLKKKRN